MILIICYLRLEAGKEEYMEILSISQKIASLRKKYRISQLELTMDKISRSYLAMIETEKVKLNKTIANLLAENFNIIFKERGIDREITAEYLLETKEEQVYKLALILSEHLDERDLETTIAEIENYAHEYSGEERIILYKKVGDKLLESCDYKRASIYYLRIVNDVLKKGDLKLISDFIVNLIKSGEHLEEYTEILSLEQTIKKYAEKLESDLRFKIYNGLAKIHEKRDDYDSALEYYEILDGMDLEEKEKFNILYSKAFCYENIGEYAKARSIYRGILVRYDDTYRKFLVSLNLMTLSQKEGEVEKIKFYFRKNVKFLMDLEAEGETVDIEKYYRMAKVSLYLNRKKSSKEYLEKTIKKDIPNDLKEVEYQYYTINNLLSIYSKKDFDSVKSLENKYFKLMEKKKRFEIAYSFISYYENFGMKNQLSEFLNKIKNY